MRRKSTLKLHHYFSAVSGPHEKFLAPWARKVEAELGGRIRIELFPSMQLGGAPAQLVRSGARRRLPISSGRRQAARRDVSPRSKCSSCRSCRRTARWSIRRRSRIMPQLICRTNSASFVRCVSRAATTASCIPPAPIKSIEDIKGLRLHVPNRLAGEAMQALGARGVTVPTPQVPMALTGHVDRRLPRSVGCGAEPAA